MTTPPPKAPCCGDTLGMPVPCQHPPLRAETPPANIDPVTWLPCDYETAPRCQCGCRKYEHRKGCLYGGRHPAQECRGYDPQQGLGL